MSKAVLLMHGYLTGPDDWDSVLHAFSQRYDEISVFCQPGHSRADEPEKLCYADFTHENCYGALTSELDRLFSVHTEVDIIGHSMGGAMGVWAAANYPVRRLCLLAPALKWPNIGLFFQSILYFRSRRKYKKLQKKAKKEIERQSAADGRKKNEILAAIEGAANEKERYTSELNTSVKMIVRRAARFVSPHTVSVLWKNTKKGKRSIESVKCPVLVLWGKYDELVPEKSVKLIIKRIDNDDFTTAVYGSLGHSMILSPENGTMLRDMLAFLDGRALEDIMPQNPCEVRTVTHIFTDGSGETRYKKKNTLITGYRTRKNGEVEVINESSSKILSDNKSGMPPRA